MNYIVHFHAKPYGKTCHTITVCLQTACHVIRARLLVKLLGLNTNVRCYQSTLDIWHIALTMHVFILKYV